MAKNVKNTEAMENIAEEPKAEAMENIAEEPKAEAVENIAEEPKVEKKMEKITLFKDNKDYKDDVFVCINGKNILVKRGEEVEIPESYAKVLKQSMAQDRKTASMMEAEQDKFRTEAAKRG